MPLSAVLAIAAAVSIAAATAFFLTGQRGDAVRALYDKIPRERVSGTILGAVALLWCVPNIRPIFMPDSPFQAFILPLILVAIVLAAIFLNYLFARAAAAILILGAHAVLKAAYPARPPGYPVLAALLLAAGVIGIVISAKPYWLRDWFRLSFRNAAVRWTSVAYFMLLATTACFCALEA